MSSELSKTAKLALEMIDNLSEGKYLIFSILGRLYAVQSQFISELAVLDTVYPLPLVPDYMPGIINRYSVPYALLDMGLLLYKTPTPRTKVMVLKDSIDRVAFLIDDIVDIVNIPQEQLFSIERSTDSSDASEMISAAFKWNGSDVFVIDFWLVLARITAEAEA